MTEQHRRTNSASAIDELTLIELVNEHAPGQKKSEETITLNEIQPTVKTEIPQDTLILVTETDNLVESTAQGDAKESSPDVFVAGLADLDLVTSSRFKWKDWDGNMYYSDYIRDGLKFKNKNNGDASADDTSVIMLFESPSVASAFQNNSKYKFLDWPPPAKTGMKKILGPCRYSLMSGNSYPSFLNGGVPPDGLLDHWKKTVPEAPEPTYVDKVTDNDTVYAYLPVEQIKNHVNDPDVHYHLAGKDSIVLMTTKTTKLSSDTRQHRPCVVKTTHSMGSRGIFIIRNDEDEAEFEQFLEESGNPTFVVTEFVDIHRNVACHFFLHPNGEIVWFGSNENFRLPDGSFSTDSYLVMEDQEKLKKMQQPFVEEVAKYCESLNFWGFGGIDVLFDSEGNGFLVDLNPRVTGSCPALMVLSMFSKTYGFTHGLFRRTEDVFYPKSNKELVEDVDEYNASHEGKSRIVLFSFEQIEPALSRINIGVFGFDMDENETVLNRFAQKAPEGSEHH